MLGTKYIFDRETELRDLERYYKDCVSLGANCGVIVYGWRRVGKTTILKEFVRKVNGVYINCIWISDPYVFLRLVLDFLPTDLVGKFKIFLGEGDPMFVLRKAFDALISLAESTGKRAFVLDEFHIFVEKVSGRIAREKKAKKEVITDDVLGLLKDIVEAKKAFWIFSTSLGWEKVRETITRPKKAESPLIAVLRKYKIEPFDKETSISFIRSINPEVPYEYCELLYRLSGGIPKILEMFTTNYEKDRPLIDQAIRFIERGELDDFFENVVKFIAEISKRDYALLTQALKAIGLEEKTTDQIAQQLRMDVDSAYVLVEELVKCEIVQKRKVGRRVIYNVKYPLLPLWVELRVPPEKNVYEIMARKLGITLESYVKEILEEYVKRNSEVHIWEDSKGTFFYGSTRELKFTPRTVLRPKDAEKKYPIKKDFDLLVITNEKPVVIEIKLDWTGLNEMDIDNILEVAHDLGGIPIIIIEKGEPKIPLIAYAAKRGVILMSGEALRLIAKKIKFAHW